MGNGMREIKGMRGITVGLRGIRVGIRGMGGGNVRNSGNDGNAGN